MKSLHSSCFLLYSIKTLALSQCFHHHQASSFQTAHTHTTRRRRLDKDNIISSSFVYRYGELLQTRGGVRIRRGGEENDLVLSSSSLQSSGLGLSSQSENEEISSKSVVVKKVLSVLFVASIAAMVFVNWEVISAFDLKAEVTNFLNYLSGLGMKGVIIYTIAFMLWEIGVGVTTPVETAAGMVFGLKYGIIANAVGKTSGAVASFLLGRYVLKDYVEKKLEGNEYMTLVQDSIIKNPLRVSLIWRFSFFPEQVKCFGLAVLPVKTWQYITAVVMHGFPFTILWTFMGNEMGDIMRGTVNQPSKILKALIGGVYIFGFFISPTLVGMWIKGLKDAKEAKSLAS